MAGGADHVLVGRHVARPQLALVDILHREFPSLRRLLEPVEKTAALLLLGDVEKELEDQYAVAREVALEGAHVVEAVLPDVLVDETLRQLLR